MSPSRLVRHSLSRLAVVVFALLFAGCQAMQVEHKTISMASRLTELQYGQVMNNLALLADRPAALPHFALTDTGHTLIQTTGQGSASATWSLVTVAGRLFDRTLLTNVNAQLQNLQQQDQDEWDSTPQLDPIQALLMRGLYHKVLGYEVSAEEETVLHRFFYPKPPAPLTGPES